MQNRFVVCVLVLISCACSRAQSIEELPVELVVSKCSAGICADLSFTNVHKHPICVSNIAFPFDGILHDDVFQISQLGSGDLLPFEGILPSYRTSTLLAVLVRLVPPNGRMESRIVISDYYALNLSSSYQIEFATRAYECSLFGDPDQFFLLVGEDIYE